VALTKIKNRTHTVLSEFSIEHDPNISTEKELLKKLKSKICSTGGHIQNPEDGGTLYVLQGNKKDEINKYLHSLGIKKDMITNKGIC